MRLNTKINPHQIRQGRFVSKFRQSAGIFLALFLTACGGSFFEEESVDVEKDFFGGVAGDEPTAVIEARKIINNGGTAVDAATAMYFALSVTLPSSASLGGGGVCLVYDPKTNKAEALDFVTGAPQTVPASATRPSAVPGNVRGFFALHSRYGLKPWAQLVSPAEKLARFGTQISRSLISNLNPVASALLEDRESRRVFLDASGNLVGEGDFITQENLAETLAKIRTNGPSDFYRGELAQKLRISIRSVRRYDSSGKLPSPVRFGRVVRWRSDEIEAWMNCGCPDRKTWQARMEGNR